MRVVGWPSGSSASPRGRAGTASTSRTSSSARTAGARATGKALLATLAQRCVDRGYGRLEWSVLDWNTPAIDFYVGLGAAGMDEWTIYRLTGDALVALARQAPPPPNP